VNSTLSLRRHRYTIRASFLEIYNEQVRDLWNPELGALQIREYPPGYWRGFYVEDLFIFECDCFEGAQPSLTRGVANARADGLPVMRADTHAAFLVAHQI
jgi:hypothetical protein